MFTSRAEYRLRLRADNADRRLTPLGRQMGLVDDRRWTAFQKKVSNINQMQETLEHHNHNGKPAAEWLRRTDVTLDDFKLWLASIGQDHHRSDALEQVLIDAKYAGYIARQQRHIERFQKMESLAIPRDVDFGRIRELRLEAREQLARIRPRTLGQAARISGINPSDITVLWVALSRYGLHSRAS
jgi:tRNA uridine 5-carboxymethylaminomethyl modification enzyme